MIAEGISVRERVGEREDVHEKQQTQFYEITDRLINDPSSDMVGEAALTITHGEGIGKREREREREIQGERILHRLAVFLSPCLRPAGYCGDQ